MLRWSLVPNGATLTDACVLVRVDLRGILIQTFPLEAVPLVVGQLDRASTVSLYNIHATVEDAAVRARLLVLLPMEEKKRKMPR
jgi:hypothetical protein